MMWRTSSFLIGHLGKSLNRTEGWPAA
jgi:hypothetical protein